MVGPLIATRSATAAAAARAPLAVSPAGRVARSRTWRSVARAPRRCAPRAAAAAAAAAAPQAQALISSTDPWGVWTMLLVCGAGGLWSERTAAGKALSGPLVSTLLALALSNARVLPTSAAAYGTVNSALLPLAIPMLLLSADMRKVLRSTGRLLLAFGVGSLGTVVGTLAAYAVAPLRALGEDGWKVASALAARHVGGAVNYVAVAEALQVSPGVVASGLAADNLLCAAYFSTLFYLARGIPPDEPEAASTSVSNGAEGRAAGGAEGAELGESGAQRADVNVLHGATALALSAALCWAGTSLARAAGFPAFSLVAITALSVVLATIAPKQLAPLVPSAEGLSTIVMMIFFAAIGASAGSVVEVLRTAPALFCFCFVQIAVHLGVALGAGSLLGLPRRDVLVASNANVGGPTTAAGFATAKGWRSLLVPGILVGVLGYATATFGAIALGKAVLAKM